MIDFLKKKNFSAKNRPFFENRREITPGKLVQECVKNVTFSKSRFLGVVMVCTIIFSLRLYIISISQNSMVDFWRKKKFLSEKLAIFQKSERNYPWKIGSGLRKKCDFFKKSVSSRVAILLWFAKQSKAKQTLLLAFFGLTKSKAKQSAIFKSNFQSKDKQSKPK